jgi:hypothetical protein
MLVVSVNISSNHILSKNFLDKLEWTLEQYPEVEANLLELEVLESSVLGDLNLISHLIEVCQDAFDVNAAIDDFGTGYSSLAHLRTLQAKTIKIDQSFVRDLLDDPSDYAIVDGVIGLAESFNRKVIAEGVETTEHGLMLLAMGCDEAQGYGIAKPMPVNQFLDWLKHYTPNDEWQHYVQSIVSNKQRKRKQFELTSMHWKNLFFGKINRLQDEVTHWPIMNPKDCHCGNWIKRARQEKLFSTESLDKIEKAHLEVHRVAQGIYQEYQDGRVEKAREMLPSIEVCFKEQTHALDLSV